jgi:acyl transferase domain-containing protein
MAGERRSHFDHRLAAVGGSVDEMRAHLQAFVDGAYPVGFIAGRRPTASALRVAFVFSGQGQQWLGMGRELLQTEPVFRDALVALDARLRRHVEWSLLDELGASEASSRLDDTQIAQPAIFAMQLALVALWESWGVRPDGVVGHSVGEIAALHVAGVLSIEDAVRIVVERARTMQRATGRGAMAAVGLNAAAARDLLEPFGSRLSIAAINGPRSVVLSGESAALAEALQALDAAGVSHRALPVNYAFHSAQMQPLADELVAALGPMACAPARVPVYSTVAGRRLDDALLDAAYFGRNVRETVLFGSAIEAMLDDGFAAFVEIAAHPVLANSIAECASGRDEALTPIASLRRARPERESMLLACAGLYAAGHTPDWTGLQRAPADVVDLPQYPWQRERHWLRDRPVDSKPRGALLAGDDGLLGRQVPMAQATVFESSWPDPAPGWLADHRIGGRLLMPGMAMLAALHAAAGRVLGHARIEIADLVLHRALVLRESTDAAGAAATTWQVIAQPTDDATVALALHQATQQQPDSPTGWQTIATAQARAQPAHDAESSAPPAGPSADVDIDALYAAFAALGSDFGPSFRSIERLSLQAGAATAWLRRPADAGAVCGDLTTTVHPAVLDGALQACVAAAGGGMPRELLLPLAVERFRIVAPVPARVQAELRWSRGTATSGSLEAQIILRDAVGTRVAQLDGVRCVVMHAHAPERNDAWLHEVVWAAAAPAPAPASLPLSGAWLLLCDSGGAGDALASTLKALGQPCLKVRAGAAARREALDCAVVEAGEASQLETLLADPSWREGRPLAGVVHLWSLDLSNAPLRLDDAAERYVLDDLSGAVSAMAMTQAVARTAAVVAPQLVLVTTSAQAVGNAVPRVAGAGLWGLASVIAVEHPELDVRIIDLDGDAPSFDAARLAAELGFGRAAPRRLALRGAQRLAPRLQHRPARSSPALQRLALGATATLDALHWKGVAAPAPGYGEVRLRVAAAGVNFRDVLLALGMIPREAAFFGAECAGWVEAIGAGVEDLRLGDAVFGFAPGSLASEITLPAAFVTRWPAELGSLEMAASLPAAYLTAMLGFDRLVGGLKQGQRVLIHAAAGGVGMAAVHLALRAGAEVFATAGSPAKRELLRSLGVAHVFDSRTLDFATAIGTITRGAGVDVVLNSLAGDFIGAGVEALAADGCFLELGKRDLWSEERFRRARPDARYVMYDLGRSAAAEPGLVRPMLHTLLAGLRDRSLAALPLRVFDFEHVGDAFRLMAQARHVGKLVLRAPRSESQVTSHAPWVRAEASYWITGGLGALGLHSARWLASRGARHLILTSRRAPDSAAQAVIADLNAQGVQVWVRQADVGDARQARAVFDEIQSGMPPLRGVLHAAGALDDGVLLLQDRAQFEKVLRGKAHGARLLDALTRTVALDFFVLYSAVGLLLGPAGQGAYAAANAELDAIAHARRAAGHPALSVAWSLWRDGGMGSELAASGLDVWSKRGLGWIEPAQGFECLEQLLSEGVVHAAVLPIDWPRFLAQLPAGVDPAFFGDLAGNRGGGGVRSNTASNPRNAGRRIEVWRALPESQRRSAVMAHVLEQAQLVLGLAASSVLDEREPLKDAGLDSLMAVELRNVLTRSIEFALPATLLFDHPSLDALATYLMHKLQLAQDPPQIPGIGGDPSAGARAKVAELSDDEAEAQLLSELGIASVRTRL